MGNICGDKQQKLTHKSKICSQCNKKQGNQVLTAFQNCSHLICSQCIATGNGNQFVCPLGPDKSNVIVEMGRQLYNSVVRLSLDEQFCSKKHKMVWRDEFQQCISCKTHMHGYKCRICNESLCTMCSKVFIPSNKKCPNKHSLTWRVTNIPCLICGVKRHGWTCRECRWYACSSCCQTNFKSTKCPNDHNFVWKDIKQICSICKTSQKVFECTPCNLLVCTSCCHYTYEHGQCPNKHQTKLVQRGICAKCQNESSGMSCEDCHYHYCTKCDLQRYSTAIKNPQESYVSVRVMVQNPLLQFQRRSTVPALKQAAFRAAKLQVPQIHLKQRKQNRETKSTILPPGPIQNIYQEINQNPQKTSLYVKLAEAYKQQSNIDKEILAYKQGYEAEESKYNSDPLILYDMMSRAANRSIEQRRTNNAIIFITNLINISDTYPKIHEINSHREGWTLSLVEQLVVAKELVTADEVLGTCDQDGVGYERVRGIVEKAMSEQTR